MNATHQGLEAKAWSVLVRHTEQLHHRRAKQAFRLRHVHILSFHRWWVADLTSGGTGAQERNRAVHVTIWLDWCRWFAAG